MDTRQDYFVSVVQILPHLPPLHYITMAQQGIDCTSWMNLKSSNTFAPKATETLQTAASTIGDT